MSIGTLDQEMHYTESGYYWQDVEEGEEPLASEAPWIGEDPPPEEDVAPKLVADWNYGDPIDELIRVLISLGQSTEAEAIRRVLVEETLEEDLMIRSLVSAKWAEDWTSPEDSVYDES